MSDETPKAAGRLDVSAIESTLTAAPARVQAQLTARPGDQFGRYKILEEIGQGGCGAVFVAEQEEPVRRRVALKVIKLGMDTRQVIARFEAERQALAMMDHPNIARVLDAGATDTGRPFFVMELVRGIKITDYCDQHKLSTSDRLKLFMQVCQAVQHAHQKGIIHRDLKPSNILVALHDGVPVPKVIDFGIAKATANQRLTDKTIYTALEQFIGTPAYMSPEQAEMSGLDIDTRSDIYSLGVLLYELLIGEPPFTSEELLGAGLDAMRRTLREKDPATPSTKLSTMTQADVTAIAQHRQSDPPKLIKSVRGDLDWIVMKCLEKDRARRYETASGLAMDIERHLTNEPVLARPQSSFYRLQKVVRRNRVAFVAGGAVTAALIIGAGIAVWEYLKEKAALQHTLAAEKVAKEEATKSAEVARILKDMLNGVGPAVARGRDTKVLREILDQTAARIGNELTNQPEVEAQLRIILSKTYSDLGEWTNGLAMAREALRLRRALYGEDHLAVAECLTACGAELLYLADFPGAEANHKEALRIKRKLLGEDHPEVARSIHDVGLVLSEEGRLQEAEPMLREAVAKFAKLNGEETVDFARALRSLGGVLRRQGNFAEAEPVVRKVAILYKKLLGADHPDTVLALNNLATVLQTEQKSVEAEPVLREVLVIAQRLYQGEHPVVATALANLGVVLEDQDKLEEAETVTRQALAMRQKLLGSNHPHVAESLGNLGELKRKLGKPAEGEQLLRQAIEILRKSPGTEPVELSVILTCLAKTCRDEGKLEDAEKALREGLALQRQERGKDAPEVADFLAELADVLVAEEKLTEAESSVSECLAIYESKLPNDWVTFSTRATLGGIFWREKKYDQAEKLLLSGYDAMNQHQDKASAEQKPDINEATECLIKLYESWGKPEKAAQWRGLRQVGPAKPADVSKPL